MSWLSGYKPSKPSTSKPTLAEQREEKRKKLEADRNSRAQKRAEHQRLLQAAKRAQEEADQALQEFLTIDPDIFQHSTEPIGEEDIEAILVSDDEDEDITHKA